MATNRQRRQSAAKRAKRLGGTILPLALALIAGSAAASHAPPAITDPAPDAFVATGIVTVAGTAPGDAVAVRVFEGATLLAETGTLNGFWSVDVAFADGAHTITAKARDSGGGLSVASTPVTFTVDTIAPAPPVIASPPPGAVLAFSAVTVEGTAEPGARIEVASDVGATWTATASGTGAWLATRTVADATYTIRATATDRAGNTSLASPSRTFRVDTLAPQPPEILTPRPGSFTNLPAVQITGSSEPGSTVRVSEGAVIGTVVAAPGGTWSLAVTFADGAHTITARATDAAGHVDRKSVV